MQVRGVGGGRLDDGRQQRPLFQGELLGLAAEVRPAGRLNAIGPRAEVHRVQVGFQDLVLVHHRLQAQGQQRFPGLAGQGLFPAQVGQLDQLLGDGAGALAVVPAFQVLGQSAADAVEVHPMVLVKAGILGGHKGLPYPQGHLLQGYRLPVLRAGQHGGGLAVPVVQHGALGQRRQFVHVQHGQGIRCEGYAQRQQNPRSGQQRPGYPFFLHAITFSRLAWRGLAAKMRRNGRNLPVRRRIVVYIQPVKEFFP